MVKQNCAISVRHYSFTVQCSGKRAAYVNVPFVVPRQLLVSTRMKGVWHIPILNGNASEPKRVVNTASAMDVQCDPARRKMFWAEGSSQVTKILPLDMENTDKAPKVVFKHSLSVRASREGLRPPKHKY